MGAGRMGSLIRTCAEAARTDAGEPAFEVVAQIGFELDALGDAPAADAIIDFSNVATLDAVAAYVRRTEPPSSRAPRATPTKHSRRSARSGAVAPVLWSGNYSIGIAALRHLVAQATRELPGFDVEIVECHHNQKVDAPSGTAKMLLDEVVRTEAEIGAGTYEPVFGRSGVCGARDPREIGVHALRGGTVAGVHEVHFFGPSEELTLTHRAESREIFVHGALAATRKLVGREPGFYTFDQVMFG